MASKLPNLHRPPATQKSHECPGPAFPYLRRRVGAGKSSGRVGVDHKKVKHGHMVEFGTRPHRVGKFHHPGARKQPFMRPAFDYKGDKALDIMITQLAEAVEKEA